jgi:hypothetical protein
LPTIEQSFDRCGYSEGQMATLLHVMICYQYHYPDTGIDRILYTEGQHTEGPLKVMTAPFQIAFSNAFGEMRVREALSCEVTISSVSGRVERIFVFWSDKGRLNGTERDDFIVYYQVLISSEIDADTLRLLTTNSSESLKARESILSQTAAGQFPLRLANYSGHTGHSAWTSETFPDAYSETVACISAFYFYGWILALRVERNQLLQDITPQIRAGDEAVGEIIEQRMRLLNLDRYFLLGDRTNNSFLKEICVELSDKYKLDKRYKRTSERHVAFENHMINTSTALQSQRAASLTKLVFLLTVLSVPLAAMQVLFGINPDGGIYQKAREIFLDVTTYLVPFAAVAVVAVPMAVVGLFDFVRGRKRKYR